MCKRRYVEWSTGAASGDCGGITVLAQYVSVLPMTRDLSAGSGININV